MFSIRLPKELEHSLTIFSKQQSIDKSKVVVEALRQYLEDKQDYLKASMVYAKNNKRYTNEEVLDALKLPD